MAKKELVNKSRINELNMFKLEDLYKELVSVQGRISSEQSLKKNDSEISDLKTFIKNHKDNNTPDQVKLNKQENKELMKEVTDEIYDDIETLKELNKEYNDSIKSFKEEYSVIMSLIKSKQIKERRSKN